MNFEKVKKVKNSRAFTVADAIIVVIIAIAIGVSAWLIYRKPATAVTVSSPDYQNSFSLDSNVEIELNGLTVVIENGEVWVSSSDCPDKTCVHTGRISRAGEHIVCLPKGVVISIVGSSDLQWEVGR